MSVRVKPSEEPYGSCDWGDCDNWATAWRLSSSHGWLPVCFAHDERRPEVERVARSVPEPTHLFEGTARGAARYGESTRRSSSVVRMNGGGRHDDD